MSLADDVMQAGVDIYQTIADHAVHVTKVSIRVVSEVVEGLASFLKALSVVVRTPAASHACIRYTPEAILCVGLISGLFWVLCRPLQWIGLVHMSWRHALQIGSFFALSILRVVVPSVSEGVFFAVLGAYDKKLATNLQAMPKLHGLWEQLLFWMKVLAACILAFALACGLAPVVMPAVAGLGASAAAAAAGIAAAFVAIGPVLIVVACVIILIVGILAGGSVFLYNKVSPLVTVWKFDPLLSLLLIFLVACGALRLSSIRVVAESVARLYFASTLLTRELLMQYAQRIDPQEWIAFRRQHCWRILGFGLPIWVMAEFRPWFAVANLQLFHGAAAGLLADMMDKPPPEDDAHDKDRED